MPPNGSHYQNVLVWDVANAYPWGDFIAGDASGVERLGCPAAGMGTLSVQMREKPDASPRTCVRGRCMDTWRRPIRDRQVMPRAPIGTCSGAMLGGVSRIYPVFGFTLIRHPAGAAWLLTV